MVRRHNKGFRKSRVSLGIAAQDSHRTLRTPLEVQGSCLSILSLTSEHLHRHNSSPQQGPGFRSYNTKIADGKISILTDNIARNTTNRYDFVITNDGKLVVGYGHSNLSNGAQTVRAAGQIKIVNGSVREITNSSGHYQPSVLQGEQAVKLLENMGVKTKGARVTLYNSNGSLNKTYINN